MNWKQRLKRRLTPRSKGVSPQMGENNTEKNIDYHLIKALEHFEQALDHSIIMVSEEHMTQKEVSKKWGVFTSELFSLIRNKGRANRMNVMKWFSLSK